MVISRGRYTEEIGTSNTVILPCGMFTGSDEKGRAIVERDKGIQRADLDEGWIHILPHRVMCVRSGVTRYTPRGERRDR